MALAAISCGGCTRKSFAVGYNRFYDIVDKYGLKVRKRRRRAKTTDSNHDYPTYPNLVKNMIPIRPNQLWVSDITYMVIYANESSGDYKFCYLSLVTDYYTKEIVGWCVGETLEAVFAIEALNMALTRLDKNLVYDIIHHSDRGVQYASFAYTFHSIEEVKVAVADAIDFYNNERPHMSLDWKTPAKAALCSGELKKKWVSHRENFLKQEIA